MSHFPFGRPLAPRAPSATSARRLFLLGAYPSALHVEWKPPAPFQRIAALAVDNEPEPFWTGKDEEARIEAWRAAVGWKAEWGTFGPVGPLNGSSGQWLDERLLKPLRTTRAETWITDCLDTYRFSHGQQKAVTERFEPFASKKGLDWKGVPPELEHPDEDAIVKQTIEQHQKRLLGELKTAAPRLVVTLGNAALRVFARLASIPEPELLKPNKDYGTEITATVGTQQVQWLPLVHPGQRSKEWLAAHTKWIRVRTRPASAPQ
jgi:uracil-DNA glycosylase